MFPKVRDGTMSQAFSIEEIDEPKMTKSEWYVFMSRRTGKSIPDLLMEEVKRKEHTEFWSDPCWSES